MNNEPIAKTGFSKTLTLLIALALVAGWVITPPNTSLAQSPADRPSAVSPMLEQSAPDSYSVEDAILQTETLSLSATESTCTSAFQDGADRLTVLQNNDGGWDWPLDDGTPDTASPLNTVGPIAMGLAHAYFRTADNGHLYTLQQAGDLLLSKTKNFSPSDGYLAAQLDGVFGGTTYVDHVQSNFYGPLASGTYDRNGAGTLYDTAGYVNLIRTARATQGIPNLAAWDIGIGLVGAASAGADTAAWTAGVKAEIDELDGNAYYDVIGLAGAVLGLAFVNEDFDPSAGEHVAAASLVDLASILVSYQINGGGFAWYSNFVIPDEDNETIQETAYAVLALDELDRSTYAATIEGAVAYMKSVQLATGGWRNWAGDGENNEITGEALWAISAGLPGPIASNVLAEPNPAPVGGALSLTAMVDNTGAGCSMIASAEYSLDGEPWMGMAAQDGGFDDLGEAVVASVAAPLEAGIYKHTLCVRGTDYAGNTGYEACADLMLVVYDPDGGFVTGGGWIDSPSGAYKPATTVWDQGFETDTDGWLDADDEWYGTVTRVPSSTDGVTSSEGAYHAVCAGDADSAPFTRFDGYRNTWPGTWTAEVDIYLDPSWVPGQGFDYSVAATGSDGNHQRDYIFHVTKDSSTAKLLVAGSNNTNFAPREDLENINHYEVVSAGWYTFQHVFYESDGALAVDLNLLDSTGTVLFTETRFNAADIIPDEVGGNRYGWFNFINIEGGIAVDEHQLMVPADFVGKASFGFVSKYKKGADTPSGNTEFVFQAADLNFHSTSYDWLVVTGSDYAKFKGSGAMNGELAPNGEAYKFKLWAGDDEPDTFRIKIWWEDSNGEHVVYDNGGDQAIGGGSIVIHTKK